MNQTLTAADGATFEIELFSGKPGAPAILWFPALGTRAAYYRPLAARFSERGWNAALVDLRGHGSHSVRASRRVDFDYNDMLVNDWPAAIAAARRAFPNSALYLAGHSLGGQLSALYLAENPAAAAGLVLTACGAVYFRGWEGAEALKRLVQTQLVGVIARIGGVFPGDRVGFGGREARGVMLDWSRNARTGTYVLRNSSVDWEARLRELRLPVLSICVAGDTFAPPKATDNLTHKLVAAEHTRVHHPAVAEISRAPHFLWARHPHWVVDATVEWSAGHAG